jgi:hypothetical protein
MNDSTSKNQEKLDKEKKHKEYNIIVNAREHSWTEKKISFEQVVELAYGSISTDPNVIYTVTYKRAHGNKEGIMVAGDSVRVKDGMVFNATQTNKS